MSAEVVELMLLVFKDEQSASQALDELKTAQKNGDISIMDAAELKKDANGKISYKEVADLKLRKKGRMIGAGVGAAVALIGGPAGLLVSTVAGGVVGDLVSRLKDKGVPNDVWKQMAEELDKGTSALVALVEHIWVDKLINEVAEYTAATVKYQLEQEASSTIITLAEETDTEPVEQSEQQTAEPSAPVSNDQTADQSKNN